MTDHELMQMSLDALEKIIEGCGFVKEEKDLHKDAKNLATLVRKDCFTITKILRKRLSQPEPDAALAEREACAKLCEEGTEEPLSVTALKICLRERNRIANAIRARGDK